VLDVTQRCRESDVEKDRLPNVHGHRGYLIIPQSSEVAGVAIKSAYTRPRLVVHGKLKELTQQNGSGRRLDADFAAGSKASDLTFS
jgi:hypothetical protein